MASRSKFPNIKLEKLKDDVLFVLRKHPEGMTIDELWKNIKKITGRSVRAQDYGVSKMYRVFDMWTDVIEKTSLPGRSMVRIRGAQSQTPASEPTPGSSTTPTSADVPSTSSDVINLCDGGEGDNSRDNSDDDDDDDDEETLATGTLGQGSMTRYNQLLSYENSLISWITEFVTANGGECPMTKLRWHLKSRLITQCNINDLNASLMKKFIKECCHHLAFSEMSCSKKAKSKRKPSIKLIQPGVKIPAKPTSSKPTAMSVMSSLSAWGKPATPAKPAGGTKSDKLGAGKKAGADVIDLTAESPQQGTSSSTSKFGSFPVPSTVLTPQANPQVQALNTVPDISTPVITPGGPIPTEGLNPFTSNLQSPPFIQPPAPNENDLKQFSGYCSKLTKRKVDIQPLAKPIEKKEFQKKVLDVRPVFVPYGRTPLPQQILQVAKECIDILAESNEHVSIERVEQLIIQRFGCMNIRQLGCMNVENIPAVHEHNRLLNKVNAYILSFVKSRIVCTLHELQDALKDYSSDGGNFLSLNLGPLQRFPLVYQQFGFPPDQAEIPEITSMMILDHLHNYLSEKRLWTGAIELEPFLDYLVEQYNVDNAYILGTRIRALPLLVQVAKKVDRDSSKQHRDIFIHNWEVMKVDVDDAFRKFRASILQIEGDNIEVRRHYMKTRPEVTITEIMEKFNILLQLTEGYTGNDAARKKWIHQAVQVFLNTMKNDGLTQSLLHMAICMSNLELEEKAAEVLANKTVIVSDEDESSSDSDGDKDNDDDSKSDRKSKKTRTKPPPIKDTLVNSLKIYIERCLNAGSLSLTHLCRMEEKLLEEFGVESFDLMGFGRFLEFLLAEAKQLLEESGGLLLGSHSGESSPVLNLHQSDIVEFIQQCRLCGLTESADIEEALCKQFNVKEVKHLGHGNISRLLTYADKHKKHLHVDSTVLYQAPLMQSKGVTIQTDSKVGILGHQTRDTAKICLHNCPLLEDLAEWSQWKLVFEPELGKLKEFITKYGGVTTKPLEGGKLATLDFLALELKPGQLMKIVSTTSAEHVATAIQNRDVQSTSGHLVSMVVHYKGVNNMPLALLSSHMKTELLKIHAEDSSEHKAAMFVLQCLFSVPTQLCILMANQMFLDPLGQVIGSSKSKLVLTQLCKTSAERNHLVRLGCLLGVHEWTNMIQQKFVLPESAVQNLSSEAKELKEELIQDEEESMVEDTVDSVEDVDKILEGDHDDSGVDQSINTSTSTNNANNSQSEVPDVIKPDISTADIDVIKSEITTADTEVDKPAMDIVVKHEVTTCEDIINQIRRDEFGVGLILSEDGQKLMKIQQERLGRSLDRLSRDLYSKDTHFVLELIQNADDNSYPDNLLNNRNDDTSPAVNDNNSPAVKFVIQDDGILVLNNELGFKETHIKALCDVGRSTKGKHKFGYIGQKGIGFKSVFRVTDAPEVHSNGFHIKFDVNSGPMGYILPNWIPEKDWFQQDDWMTCIKLTYKPDIQTRTLAARFNDIHPSLLLFLHRLKKVTIENKIDNTMETMRRRDVGNSVIEIEHSHGTDRWLVVKGILDASKISIQAKSGVDVESTELALGFPIVAQDQNNKIKQMPPKQPVFAFLPLRSYGFRFIVQGDFDVPSSREDVDRDSSWNQWLRNEIPNVFIDSLESFKSHPEYTPMEAVCTFLQFVPMEDEILDFFKPVASDILKKLKARPCVPTQPNKQGEISWKLPSQTVRVRDPLIRSVITEDLLQKHMNLFYLHDDVSAMLNPSLTSCLGIETLTSDHLFQLGQAFINSFGTKCESDNYIMVISKWLACVYRSLDEFHHDDMVLTTLKSQRIMPLANRELVSMQDHTLFYPLSPSEVQAKDQFVALRKDLQSLHPLLLKTDDEEVNVQVNKLLLRLGIKQLTPFDIINHHIIPVFKSEQWKSKSKIVMVSYIKYIKEQLEKNRTVCNLGEIKDVVVVATNKGFKHPSQETVHFPHNYGNAINLPVTFKDYAWTLLDTVYLPAKCSPNVTRVWQEFFENLGVEDFLCVKKQNVKLTKKEWESSIWRQKLSNWPENVTEVTVFDYVCKELDGILVHNKTSDSKIFNSQMKKLGSYIDEHWKKLSKYCQAEVIDKDGKYILDAESSFSFRLKSTAWLLATKKVPVSGAGGRVCQLSEVVTELPSAVYVKSDALYDILADHVLYLDMKITNSAFLKFLNLKNNVTVETIKDFLLKWSKRTESKKPAKFITTLKHMKNVYSFLGKEMKRQEFQTLLREQPVLFVPNERMTILRNNETVAGQMMSRKELWMSDKTKLFEKHRGLMKEFKSDTCSKRTIDAFYSDRSDVLQLFKQEGNIDSQPKVEEYMELLGVLCSTSTPKDKAILRDVLHIFTVIGQAMITRVENMPDEKTANMALDSLKSTVRRKLQKQKVFPSVKDVWVSLEDHPVIIDNKDWEQMFKDKQSVHYLVTDDPTPKTGVSNIKPEMIQVVLKECSVKKISEVIDVKPTPVMIEPCLKLHTYFYNIVPQIQQYLRARFPDVYKQLEEMNTKKMLADAKFYQTAKLEVCYWLTNQKQDTFVIRQEKCVIDVPTFYFHKDHLQSTGEINREIARYFSLNDKSCNTSLRLFLSELSNIVSGTSHDSLDALLRRHDVDKAVIDDADLWQVETPTEPEPIVEIPDITEPPPMSNEPAYQYWRRTQQNQNTNPNANPDELKNWPPLPSVVHGFKRGEQRSLQNKSSNVWPPPKSRDYMRSMKTLPDNIKMVEADFDSVDNTSETGTSGSAQDRDNSSSTGSRGSNGTSRGSIGLSGAASTIRPRPSNTEYSQSEAPNDRKRKLDETDTTDDNRVVAKKQGIEGQRQSDEAEALPVYQSSPITFISDNQTRSLFNPGMGQPNWGNMVTEYKYDTLGSGRELAASFFNKSGQSNSKSDSGLIGENLVADYLQKQQESGKIHSFRWVNEATETGCPFDFEVKVVDDLGTHSEFIEVKSTYKNEKDVFDISIQQVKFAIEEKDRFHIYRVFNAGNPEKVRLIRITDLFSRLSSKQVKLCMLI